MPKDRRYCRIMAAYEGIMEQYLSAKDIPINAEERR